MKEEVLSKIEFDELNSRDLSGYDCERVDESDFSDGVQGWSNWKNGYSKTVFEWDEAVGNESAGSLLINRTIDVSEDKLSDAVFLKQFSVKPGEIYQINVSYLIESIPKGESPKVVVRWKYSREEAKWVSFFGLSRTVTLEIDAAGKWQETCFYVKVPSESVPKVSVMQCHLSIERSNLPRIWFDDFSLAKVLP